MGFLSLGFNLGFCVQSEEERESDVEIIHPAKGFSIGFLGFQSGVLGIKPGV